MAELKDGFGDRQNAQLWETHIDTSGDPLRFAEGGTYDQIRSWTNSLDRSQPIQLLDGGCGEGITSLIALQSLPYDAQVTGLDLSAPLIEIAIQKRIHPRLRFVVGSLGKIQFPEASFSHAMAVNCFFHLPPMVMAAAFAELARVTQHKAKVFVTTVDYAANEDFAGAFEITRYGDYPQNGLPEKTPFIFGNPSIAGPNGTRIKLQGTPFVMHSEKNMLYAMQKAGLEVEKEHTFDPLSLVGGPEKNLFRAYWLRKVA